MNAVNFFVTEILETSNPEYSLTAMWLGHAIIRQEVDYDDQDQPFLVYIAEITDLFFKVISANENPKRVEIPNPTYKGQMFLSRLREKAIEAYHNPKLQPAEMPDKL